LAPNEFIQMRQKFLKKERLCSRKKIEELFKSGNSFFVHPFKVVWKKQDDNPEEYSVQVVFAVPKRNIKKAVDRNKIKRRIREAYRKNKHLLKLEDEKMNCSLIFIFTGRDEISFKESETKIIQALNRLMTEYKREW
jgi:ribonuclease P protein component